MNDARVWLAGALLFYALQVAAAPAERDLRERVGFDQHLTQSLPTELVFRAEDGARISLADSLHARPAVLVLGYLDCPNLCTAVLNGLLDSLRQVDLNAGEAFDVIVVSIAPEETPVLAAQKKAAYLQAYARPRSDAGWHFLTGDAPAIDRLASAVGFRYFFDAELGQYVHPTGIVLITPQGRIARYWFGVDFPPRELKSSLIEAANGHVGSLTDRLWLLCARYDPRTGTYGPLVIDIMRAGALLSVVLLAGWLVVLHRRGAQRQPVSRP